MDDIIIQVIMSVVSLLTVLSIIWIRINGDSLTKKLVTNDEHKVNRHQSIIRLIVTFLCCYILNTPLLINYFYDNNKET